MANRKITYKLTDTGHWMARCDHSSRVIELNKSEFFKLSPLLQDYIWVHEHVHLLYDVRDEAQCNLITDRIFISRAKDEKERAERIEMVAQSNKDSLNFWAALVGTVLSAGTSIAGSIWGGRNAGYYSLSDGDKQIYVNQLLDESFKESLLTDVQSAQEIFWTKLSPNVHRNKENTYKSWASNNKFVDEMITRYENKYMVGFDEVTPVNYLAHPTFRIAVIAVALIVAAVFFYFGIKKGTK